jgi:SHS2 domain-containing protein
MPWQLFDHTADVGLRIDAPTHAELFEEAARALTSLLVDDPDTVEARETHRFALDAADPEDLLFDWLQALLVAFELRALLFRRFRVTLEGGGLRAEATGERVDPGRHRLAHEVKAITYHGLSLHPRGGGWRAEVIVDI